MGATVVFVVLTCFSIVKADRNPLDTYKRARMDQGRRRQILPTMHHQRRHKHVVLSSSVVTFRDRTAVGLARMLVLQLHPNRTTYETTIRAREKKRTDERS